MRLTKNQVKRISELDAQIVAHCFGKSSLSEMEDLIDDVSDLLNEVIQTRMEPRGDSKRVDVKTGISYLGGERRAFVRNVYRLPAGHATVRFTETSVYGQSSRRLQVEIEVPSGGDLEMSWNAGPEGPVVEMGFLLKAFQFVVNSFAPYEPEYTSEEALREMGKPYVAFALDGGSRARVADWIHNIARFPLVRIDHVVMSKTGQDIKTVRSALDILQRQRAADGCPAFVMKDYVSNEGMDMIRVVQRVDKDELRPVSFPIIVSTKPNLSVDEAFYHDHKAPLKKRIEGDQRGFGELIVLVKGFPCILYDYSDMPMVEGEAPPEKPAPVDVMELLSEAERLLQVARHAMCKLGLNNKGNAGLSHETRMFALAFSDNEADALEGTMKTGDGSWRAWCEKYNQFYEQQRKQKQ